MTVIDLEELAERMIRTVRNGGTNEEIKREFMHSAKLLKEQEPMKQENSGGNCWPMCGDIAEGG